MSDDSGSIRWVGPALGLGPLFCGSSVGSWMKGHASPARHPVVSDHKILSHIKAER